MSRGAEVFGRWLIMTFRYALHIFFAVGSALFAVYGIYFVISLIVRHGPPEMVMPSIGYTALSVVGAIVFWFRRHSN